MQEIKALSVIDGKNLLALDVEPPKFIIARLMPVGLHNLSGSFLAQLEKFMRDYPDTGLIVIDTL